MHRSVEKVPSHVLWKIETSIEEDTRYKKHCTQDKDASVPFKVGTVGPHTVLPIAISCPVTFSWISSMVWNLFPFKGDFSFGKNQKSQGAKPGLQRGLSQMGDLMFHKNTAWDMMHERECFQDEVANHQLPRAVAFRTIQIISAE